MRHALNLAFVILPAFVAADARAATPTGTITFTGRVTDSDAPFAPGSIVTVHATVIAHSKTCVGTRVDRPKPRRDAILWLCPRSAQAANPLLEVGAPITARARISAVKTTADRERPFRIPSSCCARIERAMQPVSGIGGYTAARCRNRRAVNALQQSARQSGQNRCASGAIDPAQFSAMRVLVALTLRSRVSNPRNAGQNRTRSLADATPSIAAGAVVLVRYSCLCW